MLPLSFLLALATGLSLVEASSNHYVRDTAAHRHHRKAAARRSAGLPENWSLTGACLTDAQVPNRLLSSYTTSTKLTPASCIATCSAQNATYAAVQFEKECHCGSSLHYSALAGQKADASQCTSTCTGDAGATCGGNWHLTLYTKNGETLNPVSSSAAASATKAPTSTKAAATTSAAASTGTSKFKLVDSHTGSSFFSGWSFFTAPDPTNGLVNYQSQASASSQGLAYVQDDGIAVMKVDSTSRVASGGKRNSVRIQSTKTYDTGLFVFDILAMPVGCSIWPAMWAVGTGAQWPAGGEIDIIEGVNNSTQNQMTVHTGSSTNCNINSLSPTSLLKTSSLLGKTCTSSNDNNAGCAIQESDPTSYGTGFNDIGGAVYAVLVDEDGTKIWRFARNGDIPADIAAEKPAPEGWGLPSAYFPSSDGCKTSDAYKKLSLVFDITLCGDWCNSSYSSMGCPGTCADRIQDPANFQTASWKIKSVLAYQQQ